MQGLSEHQLLLSLVALAVILLVGRGTAEVARRLGQPEVLGELLGGFLLGPSVLGALLPRAQQALFLDPGVGPVLSAFSWVGAVLLLLIAGLEADLTILRQKVKPGALAAAFAIVPSLVAGTLFAWLVLGRVPPDGLFLGIVLSVTAVSIAAKILIEREALRRDYAQVILAAGIASEVVVWLLISVVAGLHTGNPVLAGLRSTAFAALFFVLMLTVGRRFVFWAMRRVADVAQLVDGQLSLVLVLAFLAAAATQVLGLHAMLGAFVFGVVLGQAPRSTLELRENLQSLAVGLFAPVFFVLAGMRIDVFKLGSPSAFGTVLLLFAVASLVKAGLAALGARLGGLTGWESLLVGVGVNLKGGTDVIVAILGVEMGLLSEEGYTLYAIASVLTVLVSPPLLAYLAAHAPPSPDEAARLEREEGRRRAYLPDVERVLVPTAPQLFPATAARTVEALAATKHAAGEVFDITQLVLDGAAAPDAGPAGEVRQAEETLQEAGQLAQVELTRQRAPEPNPFHAILEAAKSHNLLAIGARPVKSRGRLSLGKLQDQLIAQTEADVLVVVDDSPGAESVRRILVPVTGLEYSLAAGDVAAHLAKAHDAEVVFLSVMHARLDALFWKERDHRHVLEAGHRVVREVRFRAERLQVRCGDRVRLGDDPAREILKELKRQRYDLLVMGAVERGGRSRLYLGKAVHTVLARADIPTVLLVTHEGPD